MGTVDRDIGQSVASRCGAATSAVAIFHDRKSRRSQRRTGGGTRLTQQCTRSIMHRQECIRPTRFGCTASTGSKCTIAPRHSGFRGNFRGKFMSFHILSRMQYPPNRVRNYPFSTCALRLISGNTCGKNALSASIAVPGESTIGLSSFSIEFAF